jgi:hypothetical protein
MAKIEVTGQNTVNDVAVQDPANFNVTAQNNVNVVAIEDVLNMVTIIETGAHSVTVVESTIVNENGAASSLYFSSGPPSAGIGISGDFFIDISSGKLWGPRGATDWDTDALPLIPRRFVFSQLTPSDEWVITHDLDGFPSVTVVDSAGSVVVGNIQYNDTETVTLTFSGGFSGKAYLT